MAIDFEVPPEANAIRERVRRAVLTEIGNQQESA
jgi:hypothetical protein